MDGVFCQNSEWGVKLTVETDRHKRVSIHTGSRALTSGHIHPVRVVVANPNPNPNFNPIPNPYSNPNPNPNPRDRGNCPAVAYLENLRGGPKFGLNRVTSQTSFAFAETAWFCFTFLGLRGEWQSGFSPQYASAVLIPYIPADSLHSM